MSKSGQHVIKMKDSRLAAYCELSTLTYVTVAAILCAMQRWRVTDKGGTGNVQLLLFLELSMNQEDVSNSLSGVLSYISIMTVV